MVLEIYDLESNAWTRVFMKLPFFVEPHGKGLYSKGRFYWVIKLNVIYFMVAFSITERCWTKITLPEGCRNIRRWPSSLYLSGCDGRVELIQRGEEFDCICMWRLNEVQGTVDWCELQYILSQECPLFYKVVANNRWMMMVDREMEIYLCNSEIKLTKKISLPSQLHRSVGYSKLFLSAFESNNVWWP